MIHHAPNAKGYIFFKKEQGGGRVGNNIGTLSTVALKIADQKNPPKI